MHWKVKSAAFRILSAVPYGGKLHHTLQRHITHEWPRAEPVLDELIVAARDILAAGGERGPLEQAHFLEIGSGRDLCVAIALRLMGVGAVTTIDVERLAQLDLINHSAQYLGRQLGVGVPVFACFEDLLAFGVDYRAPMVLEEFDCLRYDCFYSVDTLEHIPAEALSVILVAAKARLKPDGLTVHIIDYSDHFARGSGASRLNFLRYSDRDWKPHNSRFLFTNRLRHSQYIALFERAGFRSIVGAPVCIDSEDLRIGDFAAKFQTMSVEDLSAIRAVITARA